MKSVIECTLGDDGRVRMVSFHVIGPVPDLAVVRERWRRLVAAGFLSEIDKRAKLGGKENGAVVEGGVDVHTVESVLDGESGDVVEGQRDGVADSFGVESRLQLGRLSENVGVEGGSVGDAAGRHSPVSSSLGFPHAPKGAGQ